MKLTDLFSTKEAAEFLRVRPATLLRSYVHGKRVEPIALGERVASDGSTYPHGFVFTRRMLNILANNPKAIVAPTDDERAQIFNTARAADYLGVTANALKQAYHVRDALPGRLVGGDLVFLREDLDDYLERSRPSGPDHHRAIFTAAQVRRMRALADEGMTIREIVDQEKIHADFSTVYGVLERRTYKNV